jgi:hypothetical protein
VCRNQRMFHMCVGKRECCHDWQTINRHRLDPQYSPRCADIPLISSSFPLKLHDNEGSCCCLRVVDV